MPLLSKIEARLGAGSERPGALAWRSRCGDVARGPCGLRCATPRARCVACLPRRGRARILL